MSKISVPGLDTTTRIASGLCFTKFGIMSEKNNNTVEKVLLDPNIDSEAIYTHFGSTEFQKSIQSE